jgi:hypothetical protein
MIMKMIAVLSVPQGEMIWLTSSAGNNKPLLNTIPATDLAYQYRRSLAAYP